MGLRETFHGFNMFHHLSSLSPDSSSSSPNHSKRYAFGIGSLHRVKNSCMSWLDRERHQKMIRIISPCIFPSFTSIVGCSYMGGTPKMAGLYGENTKKNSDDEQGHPHFRKPPGSMESRPPIFVDFFRIGVLRHLDPLQEVENAQASSQEDRVEAARKASWEGPGPVHRNTSRRQRGAWELWQLWPLDIFGSETNENMSHSESFSSPWGY